MVCECITSFCCSRKETVGMKRRVQIQLRAGLCTFLDAKMGTWIYLAVSGELVKALGYKGDFIISVL